MTWRIHRLRQEPHRLGLVAAAYGAALLLWTLVFPHPLTLFLPLVALTSAMAEYLFPVTYRLTTRGAYAGCFLSRLFLPWPEVRRATYGADGVHLSPFTRPTRLDGFRGVRLAFAPGNADAVLETVRCCRRTDAPAPEAGAS